MIELGLMVVLFIALSGLMSLVEASLLSISHSEVDELRIRDVWGGRALKSIFAEMTKVLGVVVIVTNFINVLGPILVSQNAISHYGDSAVYLVTAVLTIGTIVFSEVLPKSLGRHYAQRIAPLAAPLLQVLVIALYPLVTVLQRFSNLMKRGERLIGTETQIRSLAKRGRRAGLIEQDEGDMIRRAFVLNDRTARDIMTPGSQVTAFKDSDTVTEVASKVHNHAFSRYPVYGSTMHHVTGMVMSRDLLVALATGKGDLLLSEISKPCLLVPGNMQSDALLQRFLDEHLHLGVVQDNRQTLGVVTLEDVLEELVGEIEDEKDAGVLGTQNVMKDRG